MTGYLIFRKSVSATYRPTTQDNFNGIVYSVAFRPYAFVFVNFVFFLAQELETIEYSPRNVW